MKTSDILSVILCGGKGTRLGEETNGLIPKPMVDVCGKPLHERVIDCYKSYGAKRFLLATGKMGDQFRRYWRDYNLIHDPSMTFFSLKHDKSHLGSFSVNCLNTGNEVETGSRFLRVLKEISQHPEHDNIFLTYGDGVSNVEIDELLRRHIESDKTITVTAIKQQSKFGTLKVSDDNTILSFKEKPDDSSLINGGFMVVNRRLFQRYYSYDLKVKDISLENDILPFLTSRQEVAAYIHDGYWQCVDTPRDLKILRERYQNEEE